MKPHWWRYRAEGNAHILLEYITATNYDDHDDDDEDDEAIPRHQFNGSLLRVRKSNPTTASEMCLVFSTAYHNALYKRLLLISEAASEHTRLIKVKQEFLRSICNQIFPHRPLERRIHALVDYSQSHVCLVPDYCTAINSAALVVSPLKITTQPSPPPVIVVEIKPKWGFLPSSPFIAPRNTLKRERCRYCMHQLWKLEIGQIKRLSKYCPMDLYSSDKYRVRKAIDSLWEDPQNNLRIFLNGQPIAVKDIERQMCNYNEDHGFPSSFRQSISDILCGHPILKRLSCWQQRLDRFDIEFVHKIYQNLSLVEHSEIKRNLRQFQPLAIANDFHSPRRNDPHFPNHPPANLIPPYSQPIDRLKLFSEFLISVTLKDLSLLITLRPDNQNKRRFDYDIHPVDLDPKPFDRVPHYFQLDQAIVENYTRQVTGGLIRHCPCDPHNNSLSNICIH